jgi:16S rRNA A1518/A1519 N6-dimethyltransferase RsmA/KsgA/DIM1 with predicted DNA glycosylase/AP lyase activity
VHFVQLAESVVPAPKIEARYVRLPTTVPEVLPQANIRALQELTAAIRLAKRTLASALFAQLVTTVGKELTSHLLFQLAFTSPTQGLQP